jgi:hypothetical protein
MGDDGFTRSFPSIELSGDHAMADRVPGYLLAFLFHAQGRKASGSSLNQRTERLLSCLQHRCRQGTITFCRQLQMKALGLSLIVGGIAWLFSGLIFLMPTADSARKRSIEESQEEIEYFLRQLRKERGEL